MTKRHLQMMRDYRAQERVRCEFVGTTASIYIYGVIDTDDDYYSDVVASRTVAKMVDSLPVSTKALNVYINSPGGNVFEAVAMRAALARFQGTKTAFIDGLCASAATIVALACDVVNAEKGSMFMIHNASTFAYGNSKDLRESADLLDKVSGEIVDVYVSKTGIASEDVQQMMDAETWMTAEEALDKGFVDNVSVVESADDKEQAQEKNPANEDDEGSDDSVANRNRLALLQAEF